MIRLDSGGAGHRLKSYAASETRLKLRLLVPFGKLDQCRSERCGGSSTFPGDPLIAGPFRRLLELPQRPPGQRVEPMQESDNIREQLSPDVAPFQVRDFVQHHRLTLVRRQRIPVEFGHDQRIPPTPLDQERADRFGNQHLTPATGHRPLRTFRDAQPFVPPGIASGP